MSLVNRIAGNTESIAVGIIQNYNLISDQPIPGFVTLDTLIPFYLIFLISRSDIDNAVMI